MLLHRALLCSSCLRSTGQLTQSHSQLGVLVIGYGRTSLRCFWRCFLALALALPAIAAGASC